MKKLSNINNKQIINNKKKFNQKIILQKKLKNFRHNQIKYNQKECKKIVKKICIFIK